MVDLLRKLPGFDAKHGRFLMQNEWKGVTPAWPQRLLHIPTMTSHVRQAQNTYNGTIEPEYRILSYTWGRFVTAPGSPALKIHGITWDIPPIKPDHFPVSDFQAVARLIGGFVDWIWIDIACIDQKDDVMKASEIGRQTFIFRNAQVAFVWLNASEPSVPEDAITFILDPANIPYETPSSEAWRSEHWARLQITNFSRGIRDNEVPGLAPDGDQERLFRQKEDALLTRLRRLQLALDHHLESRVTPPYGRCKRVF
jgi:hypothetical protein